MIKTSGFLQDNRPALFATSYMVGREEKRPNNRTMFPNVKKNAAAGYESPEKIEMLKGVALLSSHISQIH